VEVVRDFEGGPLVNVDKHKVLQILVNLVRNAKYACSESGLAGRRVILRVRSADGQARIQITDDGVGIAAENLTRIFNHGFTTRAAGHGFGLHSGALAARELGGNLSVHSEGVGRGATFSLELPLYSEETINA
jgi:signal transduction histidine kinase